MALRFSLVEVDMPPEDLVFREYYTNKMNSSKKPKKKKKKKAADNEPLWIVFARDIVMNSFKTINSRGANIHSFGNT